MKRKSVLNQLCLLAMCLLLVGIMAGCYEPPTTTGCDDDGGSGGYDGPGVNVDAGAPCCATCICRDQPRTVSGNGPHRIDDFRLTGWRSGATVYYPTDVQGKMAGIVYCPPFTGVQSMLRGYARFLATWGIATVTMDTTNTSVSVDQRDDQQWEVIGIFKREATRSGSPLNGKLDVNRVGAMGWSMGGGATWINAQTRDIATAMSLAGHNATAGSTSKGRGIKCPTLLMNGGQDNSILGGGQSRSTYNNIPSSVPKLLYVASNKGHMDWSSPGTEDGKLAVAFQKTFLEGDTRWVTQLLQRPGRIDDYATNIRAQ